MAYVTETMRVQRVEESRRKNEKRQREAEHRASVGLAKKNNEARRQAAEQKAAGNVTKLGTGGPAATFSAPEADAFGGAPKPTITGIDETTANFFNLVNAAGGNAPKVTNGADGVWFLKPQKPAADTSGLLRQGWQLKENVQEQPVLGGWSPTERTPAQFVVDVGNAAQAQREAQAKQAAAKQQAGAGDFLMPLFGAAKWNEIKEQRTDAKDPTKTGEYAAQIGDELQPYDDVYAQVKAVQEEAQKAQEEAVMARLPGLTAPTDNSWSADRNIPAINGMGAVIEENMRANEDAFKTAGLGEVAAAVNAGKKEKENALKAAAYAADVQQDPEYAEYLEKGKQQSSKLKNFLLQGKPGQAVHFLATGDDRYLAYLQINEDEEETYYALVGKYGEEMANRYLDSITPYLESRAADVIYEGVEGIDNEALKKIARWGTTVAGSAQQARRDLLNLPAALTGSGDVIAPGTFQRAQGQISAGLEGVEKVVNDVTGNIVNMMPTLAVSFIPGAGTAAAAAMTGAKSYSNAYANAVLSGYEPGQAVAYAIPSAASEALMQYAIGGISRLGGSNSLTNTVKNAMGNALKNPAVAKTLGKVAQAGGEALEEYLQANLDPVLRNLALGEDNEINPFSEDKAYQAFLGALTSLGVNTATEIVDASGKGMAEDVAQGVTDALNSPSAIKADEILSQVTGTPMEVLQAQRAADTFGKWSDAEFEGNSGLRLGDFDMPTGEVRTIWEGYALQAVLEKPRFDAAQIAMVDTVKGVVEPLGFAVADPGAKSVESSAGKLFRKNVIDGKEYTLSDFKDNARATVLMDSWADIPTVMRALQQAYPDLEVEFKHNPKSGYIGFHVTMQQDGVNAELQLSTPEMFATKKASDAAYDDWRNRDPKKLTYEEEEQWQNDKATSKQLWDDYLEKSGITPEDIRIASSSLMTFMRNTSPAEPR